MRYLFLNLILACLATLEATQPPAVTGVFVAAPSSTGLLTCTTKTANSTQATVQAAINSASTGTVICVPAGSGTWSTYINVNKGITLAGAAAWGGGVTTISGGASVIDPTPLTSAARITGFTFNVGAGSRLEFWGTQGFRFDHNTVTRTNHEHVLFLGGCGNPNPCSARGLIDHNYFLNGVLVGYGQGNGSNEGGTYQYGQAEGLGTIDAMYVEDNLFEFETSGSSQPGCIDGNQGSRMVFRFNTCSNGRIEQHGLQGSNQRGVRIWEIYNNTFSNPNFQNYRPFFIRAGTGRVFHNTSDGGFSIDEINIDNTRTIQTGGLGAWGNCDGTGSVDGNGNPPTGWPCRDQIGRSTDATPWTNFSNPAPAQVSSPAYFWRNTQPGGEIPVTLNNVGTPTQNGYQGEQLVEGRDYYTYRSSFNGTVGVGEGLRSSRPTTCTSGVVYWSTDGGGNWNSSTSNPRGVQASGADGGLDKCTSTNTWTNDFYVPYQYPHALNVP